MRKIIFNLLLLFFFVLTCLPLDGQNVATIKAHYREMLIPANLSGDTLLAGLCQIEKEDLISDEMVQELTNRYPFDLTAIQDYLDKVDDDGSFTDINYQDTKRSGWQPKLHAERLLELCKLYASSTTSYHHSKALLSTIHRLLGFWFKRKPVCDNWWYNEIGIPKTLGQAFLIIEDELSPQEREGAIAVMDHSKFGMTGQNKVWLASNVLIKGLLLNNETLVKAARDTIVSEIRIGGTEGIMPDWSYQLHGPQQQFGNYGLAFLSSMTMFYRLFKDTPLQFTSSQVEILTNLVNQGFRWTIWHRRMDISALGRQLFRQGDIHKGYCLAFAAQELGLNGFPLTSNPLVGHKHFAYSDYTIHRTPEWMMSLKMSSARTIGSEHINEDNVLGYYLGDGATYYYIDHSGVYMDALPFWDWRKVPGTTAYESGQPIRFNRRSPRNTSAQVNGLHDHLYGISAMDYDKDGLRARKTWFFTPSLIVALGSGISTDSALAVTTSIDQRLSEGSLRMLSGSTWVDVVPGQTLTTTSRLWHNRIGYVTLGHPVVVNHEVKTGSWSDNMQMYPWQELSDTLITLYCHHGVHPHNQSYAYVVLPSRSMEQVAHFNTDDVEILCNTPTLQMVGGKAFGQDVWAAVYAAQTVRVGRILLPFGKAGLYQLRRSGRKWTVIQYRDFNNLK